MSIPKLGTNWLEWLNLESRQSARRPAVIFDGYNGEAVLILQYDPEQMARCIAEQYGKHYTIGRDGAEGDPYFFDIPDEAQEPEGGIERPKPGTRVKNSRTGDTAYVPDITEVFSGFESKEQIRDFLSTTQDYIEANLKESFEQFYKSFVAEALESALLTLAVDQGKAYDDRVSRRDIEAIIDVNRQSLRRRIKVREAHRPRGSGSFKTPEDFETALLEVLSGFGSNPTQPKVWLKLTGHRLFQSTPDKEPSSSGGKSLRNWLKKVNLDWHQALVKYWKPTETGN